MLVYKQIKNGRLAGDVHALVQGVNVSRCGKEYKEGQVWDVAPDQFRHLRNACPKCLAAMR